MEYGAERKEFLRESLDYLETKEVYDLFDYLMRELILHQPEDPLKFLIDTLKDPQPLKIIILGPPGSGRSTHAKRIADTYNLTHVAVGELLRKTLAESDEEAFTKQVASGSLVPDDVVVDLVKKELEGVKGGWVLDGFPRTRVQAQALQLNRIIPDKFILLNVPENIVRGRFQEKNVSDSTAADDSGEAVELRLQHYYRHLMGVLHLYQPVVHQVDGTLQPDQVFAGIQAHISMRPYSNAPLRPPRIVIVGHAGSGRSTQAAKIAKHYGVVHVDVAVVLHNLSTITESEVSHALKGSLNEGTPVRDDLVCEAVLKRLRQPDCEKKGWVLDGFPKTPAQADYLRKAHLTPNRFINLSVKIDTALKRLSERLHDPLTGEIYYADNLPTEGAVKNRLVTSKYDAADVVTKRHEAHEEFSEEVLHMYPHQSLTITCDDLDVLALFESIRDFVDRPLPREVATTFGAAGMAATAAFKE
ncbi:unnamed protein product [Vitrella brassicaformis CCMP3155]|uniref:Adenylate kinase n=2 Tax=Vitrella brassicaformis TaxID=1169539 RepID=A0A0G4FME6_VITBC|nr:unnamed protein product [Vitrella brassicaformis CCMP3155]|mmetsp:Transcript_30867/g.76601  ORF Transcript_30867/g.76601 Transcript_30867/m.76601 type:complete len:473 (+) Transcript_30867:172-1590(+)|eukprot:CEM14740.1 unnamed protein product [Vitrella brassicaformis CCMP3155]